MIKIDTSIDQLLINAMNGVSCQKVTSSGGALLAVMVYYPSFT
jgi:hypothetical protein